MASIRCDVKTGSVYDCGFALDLNGDGNVEYAFCCEESPHGPCSMKIFGKVSGKWKVLLPDTNMAGYCGGTDPCNGFHVLDGTNEKYHEICQEGKILEFKNGRYKWER